MLIREQNSIIKSMVQFILLLAQTKNVILRAHFKGSYSAIKTRRDCILVQVLPVLQYYFAGGG